MNPGGEGTGAAYDDAPRNPQPLPPSRVPGSVRRTSSLLMSFPGGFGTSMHLDGRCRDIRTTAAGGVDLLGEAEVHVRAAADRTIEAIEARPAVPGVDRLVGARGGSDLRAAIDAAVPDERRNGTPLHLLLDDLGGGTLIGGFVFFLWRDELPEVRERLGSRAPRQMQGICSGFRTGSSALNANGTMANTPHNVARTFGLVDPSDPEGWHRLDTPPGIATRRARRIDVRIDGEQLVIDAMFRDNAWRPDGTEVAVHEYSLEATADRTTGALLSLHAEPRVLPFRECPGAAPNAVRLVGTPLRDLRSVVLQTLRSTDCCTHLNDALRALAEVPILAGYIEGASIPT
jgi:hypothetical protein